MSGFSEKYRERGHEPFFSRPPGVGKKRIEGWDVLYEVDNIRKIRRRKDSGLQFLTVIVII
jgi:hypothetical protein